MKNKILGLILAVLLSGMAGTASATPIIAIDLDSTTPGIQSSLTVAPGTLLMIDVVAYDDGSAVPGPTPLVVTAAIMNVTSSAPGVAALGAAATAGSFAGSLMMTVDAMTGLATMPGVALTSLLPPGPGTLGFVGYIDSSLPVPIGSPLPVDLLPAPMAFVDLINLTAIAGAAGSSTIDISSFPIIGVGGLFPFALPQVAVPISGTITVSGPAATVPEPGALLLLSAGLLALAGKRAKQSRGQRLDSLG